MQDIYIWKDTIDPDYFFIGVKTSRGYSVWTAMFIDGVEECFGKEVKNNMKNAPAGQVNKIIVNSIFVGAVEEET